MSTKTAGLAGPGTGTYEEVARTLPGDYKAPLSRMDTQRAVTVIKRFIEDHLCKALNLDMVQAPLIVDRESGLNDGLGREGAWGPVAFPCGLGLQSPVQAEVLQASAKWKRMALSQFQCLPGEGICTDMRAVRKDCFLDHDHSCCVDTWDWELHISAHQRDLDFLKATVRQVWKVICAAGLHAAECFPELQEAGHPPFPDDLTFIHAEDLQEAYPDLAPRDRETAILQNYPAVFILGLGWPLRDGRPHRRKAADCDDWAADTSASSGKATHGLNGDLLVWNPVTRRRHRLSSVGIRVTGENLENQLRIANQLDLLSRPYHRAIANEQIPLSIGGGIGQGRTFMYLLRTAHLGEVTVSVWPREFKEACARKGIFVLD